MKDKEYHGILYSNMPYSINKKCPSNKCNNNSNSIHNHNNPECPRIYLITPNNNNKVLDLNKVIIKMFPSNNRINKIMGNNNLDLLNNSNSNSHIILNNSKFLERIPS